MITVIKRNEALVTLDCEDQGVLMEISDHYTFFVPGYKFMPAFRNKFWDGKIRLFNSRNQTLPHGLVKNLQRFAGSRGYKIKAGDGIFPVPPNDTVLAEFIRKLKIPFPIRDYQLTGWHHALRNQRAILVSPTGSGKSLIIYMLMRYYFDNHSKKVLIIVPTTSLVEQLHKDFKDYSKGNGFPVDDHVHRIYSGKERVNFKSRVVITTWQSAIRCPADWFSQFGMVIGDEAHTFKAKSLNTIMERLENASYRIGTTGTLDGTKVHELVLTGHFGDALNVTSTKELIENKTLADLSIQCLVLKYSPAVRKSFGKKTYQEEIDFIVTNQRRLAFTRNAALSQKGNTLVLYNLVEKHGKPLYEAIKAAASDEGREVYFVSGAVSADQRELVRELTEKDHNAIIVASMGTFSTGINIKNLHNIIFAAPTKSQIRVLQSIGRGLRRPEDGKPTTVYDISDDLGWKRRVNYTKNHAIERVKIYESQEFDFKILEVPLKD